MRRSGSGEQDGVRGGQPGLWDLPAPAGPEPAEPAAGAEPLGRPEPSGAAGPVLAAAGPSPVVVSEEIEERVVARQCAGYGCDRSVPVRATGRPARWCSQACRQRGWALRAAAEQLGRPELAEPRIVREVVERAVVRTLVPAPEPEPEPEPDDGVENDLQEEELEPRPGAEHTRVYVAPPWWARGTSPDVPDVPVASPAAPAVPGRGREWVELLDTLTARLQEPGSPVAAEHWHHERLQAALARALTALDQAHPGGLRWPRR